MQRNRSAPIQPRIHSNPAPPTSTWGGAHDLRPDHQEGRGGLRGRANEADGITKTSGYVVIGVHAAGPHGGALSEQYSCLCTHAVNPSAALRPKVYTYNSIWHNNS